MGEGGLTLSFERCLGKGGFGEVYLARAVRGDGIVRRVAVKVLREGFADESEAMQRLRDEGQMLSILDHPAILRVHEICKVGDRIALVAEYIEGVDLSWFTRKSRLAPPSVVFEIIGEVAGALDAAWHHTSPETGRPLHLLHRDVKPENVRLGVQGTVKLLDFGLARTTELYRMAATAMGEVPFTPGYAPPETLEDGIQGPEADVFALGVTLYRALAGERLFEGMPLPEQVRTATHRDIFEPFLRDRLRSVPVETGARLLLGSMLAYDRGERPTAAQVRSTCDALAVDLGGPPLRRWIREVDLPPPRDVEGASLTGRTLEEQPLGPVPDYDEWRQKKRRELAASASQVPPPVREGRPPTPAPAPRRPAPVLEEDTFDFAPVEADAARHEEAGFDLLGPVHPSIVPGARRPAVDPRASVRPRIVRTTGTGALPRRESPEAGGPSAAASLLAAAEAARRKALADEETAELPVDRMLPMDRGRMGEETTAPRLRMREDTGEATVPLDADLPPNPSTSWVAVLAALALLAAVLALAAVSALVLMG